MPLVLRAKKTTDMSASTSVEPSASTLTGTLTTIGIQFLSIYSSALTSSSALYVRANSPWPNAGFRYEAIQVHVETTSRYTIFSNSTMDIHGYIYNDTFNSLFPYKNLFLEDADAAENEQFKFTIDLHRHIKYIIVVTTYKAATTGTFSLIVHGPSSASLSLDIYLDLAITNVPDRIQWLFDGNLNDVYNRYSGRLIENRNSTRWMSPGYTGYGSAACFASINYMIVKERMDLSSTELTVSAWIWLPDSLLSETHFFPLFTYCAALGNNMCLLMVVSNRKLAFDFGNDVLFGNTELVINQWHHVAYSYDPVSLQQHVYVNGICDGSRIANRRFQGTANAVVVGGLPLISQIYPLNGFIDKLTFESRVKSSEEILEEATLVAHYPFDNSYNDTGPNQMINNTFLSTMFDSNGRFDQCLLINSTDLSYFQTTGFYYLGQNNYTFSFSLWIYPFITNGTILQISSIDGSWCVPTIGFDSLGRLTIQTFGMNGIYSSSLTSGIISLNQWTHITMTYSTLNGIQLFVNGSFTNENNKQRTYLTKGSRYTIVVGTCLSPSICSNGITQIIPSQFRGKIDELKIFSRELSLNEIAQLAQVTTPYEYDSSSLWKFDNNTLDSISNLHGIPINSPSYVISGIAANGYALQINRDEGQYVKMSTTKDFVNASFTIEMWIYLSKSTDNFIFGLLTYNDLLGKGHLLHLAIIFNRLITGSLIHNLQCRTQLEINTWYHLAFVYDYRSRSEIIYLNGIQDCRGDSAGPYLGSKGDIYIGTFQIYNISNSFHGLIDNVALTMRTKSDLEILNDATLMTWHSFDSVSWNDSSSLGLMATVNNVYLVTGKVNQAIHLNSSSSYYQISAFALFGISNQSYSISLWIKRNFTGGGVLHLLTQASGAGQCTTLIGFRSTGEIVVIKRGSTNKEIVGLLLPINMWTHIAITYSLRNGLILYINGMFYDTTGPISYIGSKEMSTLTLGNSFDGNSCYRGSITSDAFVGDIDEFRVYSRELNTMDVYKLANP
ncbi:unnamed protein product [Adineta ricciae]|nr:unnamed protein product [Adineta ricciae]